MNVTIKQLRAFINVVDAGSFTEAANRLHVTQSALSLLVRELENELGVRLLDRTSRRMTLSASGHDFYPMALKVLDELHEAINSTLQLHERQRGAVTIACTQLYGQALLPKILAHFKLRYDSLDVRVSDLPNEDVLESVLNGKADFGLAPQRITPKGLTQEALFKDRIELICPTGHALAKRKQVTWAQAMQYPFISLPVDFTMKLQADLLAWSKSLVLQPAYTVAYLTTALGMVKWGHGVTALPSFSTGLLKSFDVTRVPLCEPVVLRQISIFTRKGVELSPAAFSLRDFLYEFTSTPELMDVDASSHI